MATETQAPDQNEDAAQQHTPEPVLELSSLTPERPYITFDGKPYEIHVMDDFGIEEQQRLTRDGAEFDGLWNATAELSDADGKRLKQLLERMFSKVLKAPKTVRSKFNEGQKSQIVLAFTLAPLAAAARRQQERAEAEAKAEATAEAKSEDTTTES